MMPEYSAYLSHHGVKGQKWGVRRYQNEDGSLTAAGKQHYLDAKKSSLKNALMKPIQDVKSAAGNVASKASSGMQKAKSNVQSKLTPEQNRARKEKAKKALKIAAGVTLTAVAAYAAYKGLEKADDKYLNALYKRDDPDYTIRNFKKNLSKESGMAYMIPAGGKAQRISRYDERDAKGHAYVTFDSEDNDRYRGFFGKIAWGSKRAEDAIGKHTEVYVHDLTAKENLLSPSKETRIRTFLEMHRDNPVGVGKILGNYHTKERGNKGNAPAFVYRRQYAKMGGNKLVTKGYQTFVKALGDHKNDSLRSEYFKRLQQKGYNMVQDDQDSGKNGIHPSIVFDRKKSLIYEGNRNLPYSEVRAMYKKYGRFVNKENRHREWEA